MVSRNPKKEVVQRQENGLVGNSVCLPFNNEVDVPKFFQPLPIQPEILPNNPFNSISRCCMADFLGDRDPKATSIGFSFGDIGNKIPVLNFNSELGQGNKFGASQEFVCLCEPE